MILDIQHVGIRGYERELGIDLAILNPSYRYSCQCCVDGFYQQYLWSRGRKGFKQLGIYNPKCRIPVDIEIERQIAKGIVGVVLNPGNHHYSLNDVGRVIEFINRKRLNIYLYTKTSTLQEIEKVLDGLDVNLVLLDWKEELRPLLKESNVYVNGKYVEDGPKNRTIIATFYPYESEEIAKEMLRKLSWTFNNFLSLI
ncbi:hypothetical protein [Metallosphaera hakonensis]|uniref:Radical SAM protein n=1 Tax=Metallosphaera hakonensis JCM 8857 = DSM 7519 TaxID=1293036 RepID=A0A2U9IW97_9CREN|nr:hypothetical protein [Metallosphaera hakonensis]AWS00285.1 hypothetical protein DFR87_12030 [Metallosphaera hakonensis JCM 8857 = DSM 7519]